MIDIFVLHRRVSVVFRRIVPRFPLYTENNKEKKEKYRTRGRMHLGEIRRLLSRHSLVS